uniref:Uncharacterized protein n=1 Tax=candidate division WWE3 bacterium TaxID=2053526 RepID=A0A7C4TQE2_UNCKA
MAVISSAVSCLVLKYITGGTSPFIGAEFAWHITINELLVSLALLVVGYATTWLIKFAHQLISSSRGKIDVTPWYVKGFVAGLGLGTLYLIGGPLTQFTGNEAIKPLMNEAIHLGVTGLLIIAGIKILAIAWSKALWYRGGTIFPIIFIGCSFISVSYILTGQINFWPFLIAFLFGAFAAEKKAKILLH